jgi:predicted nucleic acid-binding protein
MIVVADTPPINYLILIDRICILETLYTRILVPHAVHDELLRSKAPAPVRAWALNPPSWLELLTPSTTPTTLLSKLDLGEAEAIALAEQLRADWLLIDEADGRDEATRRGLRTIGTLGILRDAHRAGLLNFSDEVIRLRKNGFYIGQALIDALIDSL